MNDVLSKYVTVAIEIILFSLIIAVIAVFGGVARQALTQKMEANAIMRELTDYRKVYRYVEIADLGGTVTGDDVVKFVTDFRRVYDVKIYKGSDSHILDKADVESDMWEIKKVVGFLDNTLTREYEIFYETDATGLIETFIFIY